MDFARTHYGRFTSGDVLSTRYLHAFGQPFDLPLDCNWPSCAFIGDERITHALLRNMTSSHTRRSMSGFPKKRPAAQLHSPFSGTLLCCSEPSALPEHSGARRSCTRTALSRVGSRPTQSIVHCTSGSTRTLPARRTALGDTPLPEAAGVGEGYGQALAGEREQR
ncbi:hypothetical protein C8T65DRAFT_296611 [Cerioporus squamosus]|nr:hypothetical protein C8T65DRAFT_296611 [Cerioporus squamosus]